MNNFVKKWSIELKVLAGFAVALVILAAIGGMAYQSAQGFLQTSHLASRSQETIAALEEVFSLMNQAETRQRAYIIIGDDRYLAPRHSSLDRMRVLIDNIRQSTRDNPVQQQAVVKLEHSIESRLKLLDGVLKVRHEQGFDQARLKLIAGDGEREMDTVHDIVLQMEKEERAQLERWADASLKDADRMLDIFFLAMLSVAAFFGILFLFISREMTERKRAQENLAQTVTELSAANDELKNFAYVVSHDLKAPLRAIGTLANWLSTDYADKFDDEGREHMRLLIGRVSRMDKLIDGILQYSRIGRVSEALAPVDMGELAHEVLDSLAPPANIRVIIDDNLPKVMGERTRIQQLLQNLLSNAIKYMDKEPGLVRIGCTPDGEFWRFAVSDNGPGIEARHFDRIFQLFQTLAPRDKVESTGVGLALVKKMVEMYGGKVWVESKVGEGSTFFFTLPRQPSHS